MGLVRKIKAGLVKVSVNDFVGEDGNIFFDIDDGIMRLSDGETPGGVPLSSGGTEGGASNFRQLLDTPNSFSDAGGSFVKVNPQASALEFVDVNLFDGDYNSLSNLPTLFNPSSIENSLIPQTDVAYDLGSATKKWRDLYLSGNTIFLGDVAIRNVGGTVELPVNAKVNGKKIPLDVSELDDINGLLNSTGGDTSYNDLTDLPTLFSGNYNDLTNTPTIPTVPTTLSAFTNDVGYLTSIGTISYNDLSDTPDLTVYQLAANAFSGSYNDLADTPTLFDGAYSSLSDTPDLTIYQLAANAFSGSYNDLADTPTIPTVPTTLSAFTNDRGYITGYTVTQADVTQHQEALTIAESQISDLKSYLTTVSFADLTTTPDTLAGYGITDAYTSTQVDSVINAAVNEILGDAPLLLDTLGEIADAVGDDANFVTTINNAINLKANSSDLATVATTGSYNSLTDTPAVPKDISDLTDNTNIIASSNVTEDDVFAYSIMIG